MCVTLREERQKEQCQHYIQ